jgi:hypothetical protein
MRIREEIIVFFHGRCIKSRKSDGKTKIRFFLEEGGEGGGSTIVPYVLTRTTEPWMQLPC